MKKALVLGLGISGKSAAEYLLKKGFEVVGVDKNLNHPSPYEQWFENDPRIDAFCRACDFLVKSPGITWEHPTLLTAKSYNKLILSEMELAFQELQTKNKTVFAITGSNGKTTTTLLTTHVLQKCGKNAACFGNIGRPLLTAVEGDTDIFVVELSSYQLETLYTPLLDGGVILNITPNHLDRYPSFAAYAGAKLRLESLLKPKGKLFVQEKVRADFGQHLCEPLPFPSLTIEEKVASIFPLRYRDGRNSHDFENFQAAFALAQLAGVERSSFWEAVTDFQKPPHRLEFVAFCNKVGYVNDSKATSVDAVEKAVDAISTPIVLIAGGRDKGGSYQQWVESFQGKVRKILLIGEAQDKIYQNLSAFFDVERMGTLEMAVQRAAKVAREGETVLLSPGCASFDQFKSFEHRGEVFKELVRKDL